GANLSEAYPVKANLCGADLSGANLKNALLVKANLCGCRLNGCDLSDAHLSKASLNRADLSGAKLSDTRLNGADLNEANLSSLNLGTADLTDIELAEAKGWIEIPLPYTLRNLTPLPNTTSATIDSDDRAKDEIEEEEAPTQQNFPVGRHPQIILQDILAPITVQSWSEPTILLETTGEIESVKQDGDLLLITGCDRPLTLHVPLIKHGTLALQSTFNSIITTAIQANRVNGEIVIEDAGAIILKEVRGSIFLNRIAGDVELEDIVGTARLSKIAGNVRAIRASQLELDAAGGNLHAEQIQEAFYCGSLGGNCLLLESEHASVSLGRVGGNLYLTGIAQNLDCTVGGNAQLRLEFPAEARIHARIGGTLTIQLPEEPNLYMNIATNGLIRGEAIGATNLGSFANLRYGSGSAKIDLVASGGLDIRGVSSSTRV
ncbi:MAG TPA: pentapeptide repeat-containing protein, partial [Ktedonobacteraceae bacterium]|nr:pentapeptide repeat-containing protein [Ktedonobacteraceae bacterium]